MKNATNFTMKNIPIRAIAPRPIPIPMSREPTSFMAAIPFSVCKSAFVNVDSLPSKAFSSADIESSMALPSPSSIKLIPPRSHGMKSTGARRVYFYLISRTSFCGPRKRIYQHFHSQVIHHEAHGLLF